MVRRASGFHQGGSGFRPVLVLQQDLIQLFSSGLPWGASAKDCRSSAEGGNLRIDYRWGWGSIERTRTYAAELVALKPDVIVGGPASAAVALHRETRGPAPRRYRTNSGILSYSSTHCISIPIAAKARSARSGAARASKGDGATRESRARHPHLRRGRLRGPRSRRCSGERSVAVSGGNSVPRGSQYNVITRMIEAPCRYERARRRYGRSKISKQRRHARRTRSKGAPA